MTLPDGWTQTTLGALGRYVNGRGFKKSEWGVAGRPIIRIQNLTGSGTSFNYYDGPVEERYVVRDGDLLVSWAATLGAYVWRGPEALLNQHIFRVESNIDPGFHKYLLEFKLQELMRHTHGSGMVHITKGNFDSVPVALPAIDEQRRIVEILEDHLSRLDAAQRGLVLAASKAKAWADGVADAALFGHGHLLRHVGDLLREGLRNGHSAPASQSGIRGLRTLTLTAVTRSEFSDRYTKLTSADPGKVADLWLKAGDILVQRSNTPDLVGSAALYSGADDWSIFPDLMIRLRCNLDQVSPRYLVTALRAERTHRLLRSKAKGLAGSMPKIDQAAIASLQVPVPISLADQAQVTAEVLDAESSRRRLDGAIERASRQRAGLSQALLTAAFSGQLTSRVTTDKIKEMAGV